jgi:hypothetical protein
VYILEYKIYMSSKYPYPIPSTPRPGNSRPGEVPWNPTNPPKTPRLSVTPGDAISPFGRGQHQYSLRNTQARVMPPPPPRPPQLLHNSSSLLRRNAAAEALEREERYRKEAKKIANSSPAGYHKAIRRNYNLLAAQRRAKELLEQLKKQKSTHVILASTKQQAQEPISKKQRLGGNSKIYIGPKNGKFIIKNGSKVYIDSNTLSNNVQYKKRKPKKNKSI